MRKLFATSRHGNAMPATGFHVTFRNGRYEVRDGQQRFRCSFLTQEQADAYVTARSVVHRTTTTDLESNG